MDVLVVWSSNRKIFLIYTARLIAWKSRVLFFSSNGLRNFKWKLRAVYDISEILAEIFQYDFLRFSSLIPQVKTRVHDNHFEYHFINILIKISPWKLCTFIWNYFCWTPDSRHGRDENHVTNALQLYWHLIKISFKTFLPHSDTNNCINGRLRSVNRSIVDWTFQGGRHKGCNNNANSLTSLKRIKVRAFCGSFVKL